MTSRDHAAELDRIRNRCRNRVVTRVALLVLGIGTGCGPQDPGRKDVFLRRPDGDVLSAGSVVDVSDSVTGDAMLVGASVEYSGLVGGSYLGAGGVQEVDGGVEGSARVVAGTIRLGASVGRNVTLVGGNVLLQREAVVEHNAYLAGGFVRVEGVVRGDLYVGAQEVVLDGVIEGDARVEAARLTVGPAARIRGDLRYRVESDGTSIDSQATVEGDVVALANEVDIRRKIGFSILRVLAFLLCGGAMTALFPGTVSAWVAPVRQRPVAALGVGLLWIVGAPLFILALVVTLVGLPLALLLAGVYGVSIYLAPAVPAIWLGELLLPGRNGAETKDGLRAFLVGGPLVAVAIMLPWAGVVLRLVVGLLGLGAMVLTIVGRSRRPSPGPGSP
jgi:hypothetical protein